MTNLPYKGNACNMDIFVFMHTFLPVKLSKNVNNVYQKIVLRKLIFTQKKENDMLKWPLEQYIWAPFYSKN